MEQVECERERYCIEKFRGGLGPTDPWVSMIIDIMAQFGVRG
jgi:hypothetical protein